MALALGLGSLFNHSNSPNVSFSVSPSTETIRYMTTRSIKTGEELCIFYGHRLWFKPAGETDAKDQSDYKFEAENDWEVLRFIMDDQNPFSTGKAADIIPEADLPFLRTRVTPEDEDEDEEGSVRTMKVWVVDIPDPKMTSSLLKWVKVAGLETPDLIHLKRIRRTDSASTLLLAGSEFPPSIPEDLGLPQPYQINVPVTVALTPKSLKLKLRIWPTVYAPRRKGEPEPWSRAKAAWAWEAVETLKTEANKAAAHGELPVVSYVPPFFHEEGNQVCEDYMPSFLAHDTRRSATNPLRHSVVNVIRKVADWRASNNTQNGNNGSSPPTPPFAGSIEPLALIPDTFDVPTAPTETPKANGTHYLLTSLTLFTTHEPCVMCSMALLHSRVREIIFLFPMDATGGCGGCEGKGVCVPRLRGVNHRYNIMRWKTDERGGREDEMALMAIAEDVDA
ncbi:hypothetical protein M0805_004735 [Coniferiporia weirii]|nr:hypothetical protein M0805_004735 [Coniferiporia weirii]